MQTLKRSKMFKDLEEGITSGPEKLWADHFESADSTELLGQQVHVLCKTTWSNSFHSAKCPTEGPLKKISKKNFHKHCILLGLQNSITICNTCLYICFTETWQEGAGSGRVGDAGQAYPLHVARTERGKETEQRVHETSTTGIHWNAGDQERSFISPNNARISK